MKFFGTAIVFGAHPVRPIVNIPPDARKVRIRMRNTAPAQAFVKFDDRIEHWILCPADGTIAGISKEWRIDILQGVNKIQKGNV